MSPWHGYGTLTLVLSFAIYSASVAGELQTDSSYPDKNHPAGAAVDSVWLSEKDVMAAEQAHPLLGRLLRSSGNARHRLYIDPNLKGLATGPEGREVLFRFHGKTERTEEGVRFHFELDGHPSVASLEGELTPSSAQREPRGFVQVTPVADSEQRERQPKLLEW